MSAPPIRLLGCGGEQTVAGQLTNLLHSGRQLLAEALRVAQLVHEFLRADDDELPAG